MVTFFEKFGQIVDISAMLGRVFTHIEAEDDMVLRFECKDGIFQLFSADGLGKVFIESIVGDLNDLVGSPLLLADEFFYSPPPMSEDEDTYTWTLYRFATRKGYVDVWWYGTSNGDYSESADFYFKQKNN